MGKVTTKQPTSRDINRLHKEMEAFYADIHKDDAEFSRRLTAIHRLTRIIKAEYPRVIVDYYGSTMTGLYLPTSDIDIVVILDNTDTKSAQWLEDCFRKLGNYSATIQRKLGLLRAKVPILKLVDVATGIDMDVSCVPSYGSCTGKQNSEWIQSMVDRYPALPKLLVYMKKILLGRCLGADVGGISSYALTLMTVSFFQHQDPDEKNLGKLFRDFFRLYGCDFNYTTKALIVTGDGQIVSNPEMRAKITKGAMSSSLSIEDPVDPGKDAALSSQRGVGQVKQIFRQVYEILTPTDNDNEKQSRKILDRINRGVSGFRYG